MCISIKVPIWKKSRNLSYASWMSGIIITYTSLNFFGSLARSRYLTNFSPFFMSILFIAEIPTWWQVLFVLLIKTWPGLYVSHFLGQISPGHMPFVWQCLTCQTTCTVKHILIECRAFAVIRKRFFKVNNLTDLFENVKIDDILSFLRETELYQKIWQLKTG